MILGFSFQVGELSWKCTKAFLTGSYSRRTCIKRLNDVDIFAVFECSAPGKMPPSLEQPMREIQSLLQRNFRASVVKLQHRSVNVHLSSTDIWYDVVPAFPDPASPESFYIPDKHAGRYIASNPLAAKRICKELDTKMTGKFRKIVRLLKHWNKHSSIKFGEDMRKPFKSFHLEVMAYSAFPNPPPNLAKALEIVFMFILGQLRSKKRTAAPGVRDRYVDDYLDDCQKKGWNISCQIAEVDCKRINCIRCVVANAYQLSSRANAVADPNEAHNYWRRLLGGEYQFSA